MGTCFSLALPSPMGSVGSSTGDCSCRMSPDPVTPTCGNHHLSPLVADGRVTGERAATPYPPSDAVDGACVCQSERCPWAAGAQGWIWCSPWGSRALCVIYFLMPLLPASPPITSHSSSSCSLLRRAALSQQPESGAAGAGQGRAQPVLCSLWLPPPARVCSGPIQSWMLHPVQPALCLAAAGRGWELGARKESA